MALTIKQFSSLEKYGRKDAITAPELTELKALRGERASYQIAVCSGDYRLHAKVQVKSELSDAVKLFREKEVFVDTPTVSHITDEDYLLTEPGFLPDVLVPIEEQNHRVFLTGDMAFLWVRIDVPHDIAPGTYPITVSFGVERNGDITAPFRETAETVLMLHVADAVMPKQNLIYTRWMYLDCIADAHHVPVFSEEHWDLIEQYIAKAHDFGINMLLVPMHTPPLDTEVGTRRPCVQLADIEKIGDVYHFGFERLERFVALCKKHGIEYYEMTHMFSQWGAAYAPNIMVTENGKTDYLFGWHVSATSELYVNFLKQYITAISAELKKLEIEEKTYFHISDEPVVKNMEQYAKAREIFKPLVGKSKIFDALSHLEFYEAGLVTTPVTIINNIHMFLERHIEDQWVYYCNLPEQTYCNSLIAMSSARIRVLGYLIYKYDIKGFLHWGFNFYNAARSKYRINPYLTTSADGAFGSGDAYIVYPANGTVHGSIRGELTYQALEDIRLCKALEEKLGRDAVIELIDRFAGRDLRFDDYPAGNAFLEGLHAAMIAALEA